MGHRGKKTANATVGLLFDVLGAAAGVNTRGAFSDVGARAFSQDFEREADHVGMYYLAQAGYPTEGAAQFWRRMATEHPASIRTNLSATHPATAERFIALERIATDIRDKQGRGEPLTPVKAKP
jgi:predicted Zn-dependent protease